MNLTFLETPVFTELVTDLLEDEDYRQLWEQGRRRPELQATGGNRYPVLHRIATPGSE